MKIYFILLLIIPRYRQEDNGQEINVHSIEGDFLSYGEANEVADGLAKQGIDGWMRSIAKTTCPVGSPILASNRKCFLG